MEETVSGDVPSATFDTNVEAVTIPEESICLTDVISSKSVSMLPTANLVPADIDVVPTPNA